MDQRHQTALSCLVQEYIASGQPVSSNSLAAKTKLNLSPATIRSVMQDLCDEGYIYQPHTSAGRIPTDRGYRYYINHLSSSTLSDQQTQLLRQELRQLSAQYQSLSHAVAELLSMSSQSLALVGPTVATQFEQSGISRIIQDSDEHTIEIIKEVTHFLDHIHQYTQQLASLNQDITTVYVGEENPYYTSTHTSLLMRLTGPDPKQSTLIMLIGPKRMPYDRNISLLNEVAHLISH